MKRYSLILATGFLMTTGMFWWTWKQLHFAPVHETIIRLSLDNAVESLDPAKAYSDDALVVSSQVLETLYQYHYLKRPYEVQPLLADGMPVVQEKGRLITVKIRKGIFYHDHHIFHGRSRELSAKDFELQFKRLAMKSLKSPGASLFAGLIVGFDEFDSDWKSLPEKSIEGIKVLDEKTLQFRLTRPEPNFIYYLSLNFTAPVPWEIVKFTKNDLNEIFLGTGPYIYKGFHDNFFEMEKNRKYRDDFYPSSGDRYANVQKLLTNSKEKIPFIDKVRFYLLSKEEERWERFLNKDIDLLTVPKTFIPKLHDEHGDLAPELKSKNVELKHFPTLANRWLAFNMRDPLLGKNESLRRAIAYAIDYDEYIHVLSQNTNLRANSILVPGIAGYAPAKTFRFRHDLELAREYLKLARIKPDTEITYSTRGTQNINLIEGELIKKMLAKLDLRVKVEVLTFPEFLKKGRAGELMLFTDNWLFDYPDGENILQLLISSNVPGINKAGYKNPEMDRLYMELKNADSTETRDRIIHQMEEKVFEDLPWIPLMYESSFVLHYPQLKNFRKSSIIRNYVKYLKLER